MKLYQSEPKTIIRLQICKQGAVTEYISLVETNKDEVADMIKKIVEEKNISPFIKDRRTSVNIREALGGQNGKSTSISFIGINPDELASIIKTNLYRFNKK